MWPYGFTQTSQASFPRNAAPETNQEGMQNSTAYNFTLKSELQYRLHCVSFSGAVDLFVDLIVRKS